LIDFIQFNHKHYFLTSHNRDLYICIYIYVMIVSHHYVNKQVITSK